MIVVVVDVDVDVVVVVGCGCRWLSLMLLVVVDVDVVVGCCCMYTMLDHADVRREWRNGRREGVGRYTDSALNLVHEGLWKADKRQGKGRESYIDGTGVYEGSCAVRRVLQIGG